MRYLQRLCPALVLAFSAALLASAAGAQTTAPTADLAFQRAQHLRRGINTSNWFAQSTNNYSTERLRSFTTMDDLALIHSLGFDHIRLSVDADPLTAWQAGRSQGVEFMAQLDAVIHFATAHQLAVILTVFPETRYKQQLFTGSDGVDHFLSLWRALAAHFASADPNLLFFEIMNEPEQQDAYRWQGIETDVALAIRQTAPQFTIIACGAHWDGLPDLLALSPIGLDNVIYTFHDYEPFAFTHQGATWTDPHVQPLRAVPYPSTPEAVAPNLAQEPDQAGQWFVEDYGLARWDLARVDATIAFAARWSALHHAPVYCGEFGVHRPFAPPADRAHWLHDMRVTLEKDNIGWAMWDYQANFGLVTKKDGVTTPDPALLDALGLHAAQP